jgi:hypothetical protein
MNADARKSPPKHRPGAHRSFKLDPGLDDFVAFHQRRASLADAALD